MSPSTLHAIFKKAGITIRHMWELRFSDPEIPHLNNEKPDKFKDRVEIAISELPNGYFVITDYGHMEVRYGIASIMIHRVLDNGHDTKVRVERILPIPVNMLDTSVIIHTLREFKEHNFGY